MPEGVPGLACAASVYGELSEIKVSLARVETTMAMFVQTQQESRHDHEHRLRRIERAILALPPSIVGIIYGMVRLMS